MNSNTKKIVIGSGLAILGLATAYLILKNKRNRTPIGIIDDEKVNIDYANVNGSSIGNGINAGIDLSLKDYKKSVEETLNDKKYEKYLGRKIYTLVDNVNIRMGANINNGFFSNIAGTIPLKKTFIGKVVTAKLGDDKKIWFAVNEENSNRVYEVKKNFSWDLYKPVDPSYRWFRSDVVVINMKKKK